MRTTSDVSNPWLYTWIRRLLRWGLTWHECYIFKLDALHCNTSSCHLADSHIAHVWNLGSTWIWIWLWRLTGIRQMRCWTGLSPKLNCLLSNLLSWTVCNHWRLIIASNLLCLWRTSHMWKVDSLTSCIACCASLFNLIWVRCHDWVFHYSKMLFNY